jgi:hypothetical protein
MAAGDRGRRCGLNYKPSFRPSEARAGTQGHALERGPDRSESESGGARSESRALPVRGQRQAVALGEDQGMVKVVFDAKAGELPGAHMVGAEVTELIQGYVVAMTAEAVRNDARSGAGRVRTGPSRLIAMPRSSGWLCSLRRVQSVRVTAIVMMSAALLAMLSCTPQVDRCLTDPIVTGAQRTIDAASGNLEQGLYSEA